MEKGSKENPIEISSVGEFSLLGCEKYNGSHFILTDDIHFDNPAKQIYRFLPDLIKDTPPYDVFTGHLDGNGHIIYGLKMKNKSGRAGIFKTNKGVIKNLLIKNCYVSGERGIGVIVSENEGKIESCYVDGKVEGNIDVGGIAAVNLSEGKIVGCVSDLVVEGEDSVGSIVGKNYGSIINCSSTGSVIGNEGRAGGISGLNKGEISRCASSCLVFAWLRTHGGLVGLNQNSLKESYFSGEITDEEKEPYRSEGYSGMLVGKNQGEIDNCYHTPSEENIGEVESVGSGNPYENGRKKNIQEVKKSILIGKI